MIEKINNPSDLKKLSKEDLPVLAEEIRSFIIETVSKTGGHLASNLGVVELTLVLHYLFDSPKDSFIFDVGHQSYIHKILTGRRDKFNTLRQFNGISGFPKREESEHDIAETGHAGTSISYALGLSIARKLQGVDGEVIAIIGDGAMTSGMALEAMNNISNVNNDLIVIVNNNDMSIGNNIGVISKALNTAFNEKLAQDVSKKIKDILSVLPFFGKMANDIIYRLESSIRSFVTPSIIFREFGFKYFGPIDGHNYDELFNVFENIKNIKGPRLIHINTVKGKGYEIAEKNPAKFHGISPFDVETGALKSPSSRIFSNLAGECIIKAAHENESIIAITAAMESGTGLGDYSKIFPNRFFDVGIAEEHATTFASGASSSGMTPCVFIYSTFMQRAFDQVMHDVALMNANVKFMIDRAGLVPDDGDTHQGIYDVAFLKIIPNMTIFAPVCENDFRQMFELSISIKTPTALRYPKDALPAVNEKLIPEKVEIGKCHIVDEGSDFVIISYGVILNTIYDVSLKSDKNISIINLCTVKPLDELGIVNACKKAKKVLVIEESVIEGGVGESIASIFTKHDLSSKLKIHGIENKFLEVGTRKKLLEIYKFDFDGITSIVEEFFS